MNAEKRLAASRDIENEDDDEEENPHEVLLPTPQTSSSVINRHRRSNGSDFNEGSASKKSRKLIADDLFAKTGVRTHQSVAAAINTIDSWMLVSGRYVSFNYYS